MPDETTEVAIKHLQFGMSPRLGDQDLDHARTLAHRFEDCPPILVDRSTGVVIDGVHRVLAARIIGRATIDVRYFDGTHEEAYLESVQSNISHGKALTLAEREAAAKKILTIRGEWSDRRIGECCGLSDKTIGRLREASADIPRLATRVGRDGRERSIDPREKRLQIAAAIQAKPDLQSVELARSLKTSRATIRDVRKRLENGEPAISSKQPSKIAGSASRMLAPGEGQELGRASATKWASDPAITACDGGRKVGEWLDRTHIIDEEWRDSVGVLPLGRIPELIEVARARACEWNAFASALELRARELLR